MDGRNPAPVNRWFIPLFIFIYRGSTIQGGFTISTSSNQHTSSKHQDTGRASSPWIVASQPPRSNGAAAAFNKSGDGTFLQVGIVPLQLDMYGKILDDR